MDRKQLIAEHLKQARAEMGLSQEELGRLYGCTGAAVSQMERGVRGVSLSSLERFTGILGKTLEWFLSDSSKAAADSEPRPVEVILKEFQRAYERVDFVRIPIVGTVPAGKPFPEEEQHLGYVSVPKAELARLVKDLRALKVAGNSLSGDEIYSGDLVIVERGTDIVDGKIYVLLLGNEVVARHIYKQGDKIKLVSSDGVSTVIEPSECEVLGRVVLSGRWKRQ